MKKIIFIFLLLFCSFAIFAQTPFGGPDSYGYTWRTNDDPLGPTYNWIDIETHPASFLVTGLADDNSIGPFPIGFMFEYYGTLYNSFMICSNGSIRLGAAAWGNSVLAHPFLVIPTGGGVNAYIAPFGTDLVFDPSIIPPAEAFYWNSPYNDSLVVSWIRVPFWANTAQGYTGENTFQLILEKNTNRITFQYQTQIGVPSMIPNFTTVGIESPSGLSGLNPLYDVLPTPVTAIRFDVGEYNKVKGRAFVDLNSNNVQDGAEPNFEGKLLTNVQNATYALTGINGDYTFSVSDTSAFDIYPPTIKHYSAVPANHTGFMTGPNHVDSLNDFIYQPDSIFDDLEVRLNQTGPFRPGFNAGYVISYANKGTTFLTPQLMLHKSPALSFISSTVTPSLLSPGSLVFNLPQLPPLQSGMIQVMFKLDSTTSIGAMLMADVQMTPVVNDAYPLNNTDTLFSTVGGSFDPNDITVDRVSISIDSILNPIDLTYLIRFQNTGTDTAFNVYVVNDLPLELDLLTFEILGASHPNQINLDANTRRLVFNFPLILLPDSNVNEPASHGFILYRVRPQTTLQLGDTIPNSAAIYFDFNLPVLTNTALTIIQSTTIGLNPLNDNSIKMLLFPNPVADQLNISGIKLENGKAQLRLMDIYGKLIYEKTITSITTTLETNQLSNGIYLIQVGELRATFVKQ